MSSINSSPRRASSNNSKLKSTQHMLKGVIREELGSQTWHFPPDIFIRMLSPKTPRNPEKPKENVYIEDFYCDTDKKAFRNACERAKRRFLANYVGPGSPTWNQNTMVNGIQSTKEDDYYEPTNRFLNQTIEVCRAALNNTTETLFQNVRFFDSHDKETMDTAKGSSNLKPDLIMEEIDEWPVSKEDRDKREKERFWWNKSDDNSRQITLVCELKNDWVDMVSQLATYARCQFDACPSRLFVLAIAFNHISSEARFLIFHRSGLTASHVLILTKQKDQVNFLKIFMTVMIWKEGRDAGFSDFNDNTSYNLGNTIWDISGRLHHTTCVRGRATIVNKVIRRGLNPPDQSTAQSTVQSETGNVNVRKRKLDDGDGNSVKSSKRMANRGISASNTLEKINENSGVSVTSARRIFPSKFCFPVKARGPPNHYLKAHQKNPDDPTHLTTALKECWSIKGRENIEGESLGSSVGEFGVANIRATYIACYSSGQLQSTSIFLPKDKNAKKYHYPIYEVFSGKLPELRIRVLIELSSIGKSFVEVEPGKDLATCVAHSMLGWLNVYQRGFLHRDISIGNVLAFKNAEERKPFQLTAEFREKLGGVTTQMLNDKLALLDLEEEIEEIFIPDAPSWATNLEELLESHNIGTVCEAFVIDGDMAKNWKALFAGWGKEKDVSSRERSGTELFMSVNLLSLDLTDYIQSPIDDIESFVWVTLYAILKNEKPRSLKEQKAAEYFELGDRSGALQLYLRNLQKVMNDLVKEWSSVVLELGRLYAMLIEVFSIISEKNGWQDEEEEARYWEVAWHGYTLQGVCQSLEIILRYINPRTI